MQKSLKISALAIVAAGSLIAGSALAEIKIGVAGPHTGPYAAFGMQLWKGAAQAAKDINAAGGINGERLFWLRATIVANQKKLFLLLTVWQTKTALPL